MRKYVTEFIGTFGLVFTVGMAVFKAGGLAPLAIGAVLMVLVYAGGHISGAHYNPAVTLGVFLRGKMPATDVLAYWASQLLAALVAAWFARFIANPAPFPAQSLAGAHGIFAALLAEFFFTFALVYVVLNVVTSKDQPNNHFFGLAIGFTDRWPVAPARPGRTPGSGVRPGSLALWETRSFQRTNGASG